MIVDWNTKKSYQILYMDPPWTFKTWSEKGLGKSAQMHYDCMSMEDIQNLPIERLATKDSLIWMWVTKPLLDQQIILPIKWGYHYVTVGFTWIKLNKKNGKPFMGLGKYTRANPEQVLIFRKGTPPRPTFCPNEVVFDKIREHSRKPDSIRDYISQMYPTCSKLELFARSTTSGWDCLGNQTEKFNEISS